eukprot:CAMPEP_0184530882 /NCGR_PEP_ID=MMETSP0198_2-20121128/13213_1 /TAXON_ID=1112570 /ORGANISM="Thraustochytrium sp., Strain LLF1b" /LENGTH=236 /DNA_ID=CAMNT_0026923127 /DNA_START=149 /DNA_END=859 /DNA_ORIENTATION=+
MSDPFILFSLGLLFAPLALARDVGEGAGYLFSYALVLPVCYLVLILYLTHSANCVQLSSRERKHAARVLCQGVVFTLTIFVLGEQVQGAGLLAALARFLVPQGESGSNSAVSTLLTMISRLGIQLPFSVLAYYALHRGKGYRYAALFVASLGHIFDLLHTVVPRVFDRFQYIIESFQIDRFQYIIESFQVFEALAGLVGIAYISVALMVSSQQLRFAWEKISLAQTVDDDSKQKNA